MKISREQALLHQGFVEQAQRAARTEKFHTGEVLEATNSREGPLNLSRVPTEAADQDSPAIRSGGFAGPDHCRETFLISSFAGPPTGGLVVEKSNKERLG